MSIPRASALPLLVALLLAAAPSVTEAHGLGAPDAERRIRFFGDMLARKPGLYPAMNELGRAYLDMAQNTGDPAWLAKARAIVLEGLKVQITFEGYRAMMMIENYSHRFEAAAGWAEKAALASTNGAADPEPEIRAGLIEAYTALGREADAQHYLPPRDPLPEQFEAIAALAHWEFNHGKAADAVVLYERAAQVADKARSIELVAFARVAGARGELKLGRLPEAEALLLEAKRLIPEHLDSPLLASTLSQLRLAQKQPKVALAELAPALQAHANDGELHWRAFLVAQQLGDAELTKSHFEAAERAYRAPIEAGEVYSFGALARLYLDAGQHLDEAKALAEKNFSYRKDPEARAILEETSKKLPRRRG